MLTSGAGFGRMRHSFTQVKRIRQGGAAPREVNATACKRRFLWIGFHNDARLLQNFGFWLFFGFWRDYELSVRWAGAGTTLDGG